MAHGPDRSEVRSVRFDDLTPPQLAAWGAIRAGCPDLDSPYFHPGFAAAVHRTGHDVHVAVAEDAGGTVCGLLPVHRRGAAAFPVGWPAADFQGPIRPAGAQLDPRALLSALKVRKFAFDHLTSVFDEFTPWVEGERPSPFLDVSGGFEGYRERASRSGKDNMAQARRRARKAERELGPVRFVAESDDPDLLAQVIALKRAQYLATGARDYFADARHRALVHDLLTVRDPDFGGILSGVYAGDKLLAAHFGLRAGRVLHWWFPVYDPALAQLAPGWILLRELVEAAPGLGVDRIDLGRGEDEYKRRAMTGSTAVRHGVVTTGAVAKEMHRLRKTALSAARSSAVGPTLRRVAKRIRQVGASG